MTLLVPIWTTKHERGVKITTKNLGHVSFLLNFFSADMLASKETFMDQAIEIICLDNM